MSKIIKRTIAPGIVWVEIKAADLSMCCGCPADTVKHLIKARVIRNEDNDKRTFETGPNVLLLSDTLIQNGKLANLSEFVLMQIMYLQGIIIPGHPNFGKFNPIIIGYEDQVKRQLRYVDIGNHGHGSEEEIIEAGFTPENARKIVATKLHYASGAFRSIEDFIDKRYLEDESVEIKNGVFIKRKGVNKFEVSYEHECVSIDLGLNSHQQYHVPYDLPFRKIEPSYFSITHIGEGNGWDIRRPCMSSLLHYKGKNYLIDAGPNIMDNLQKLGIGLSEIDGIFITHIHDDHFAGITDLLNVERRLNLFCINLVRKTAENKLSALFHSNLDLLKIAFNYIELAFDEWNNLDGLEVLPTYSPHTVETTVFHFRVRYNGQEKSYLHLADTINFDEFDKIIQSAPEIFTNEDRNYVRDSYMKKVNLKKLDVGGGLIHGHLSDYANDQSDSLVMAHTTNEITGPDSRFRNAEFGSTDHLIQPSYFNLYRIRAKLYLSHYSSYLTGKDIDTLNSLTFKHFLPGEKLLFDNKNPLIYLLISGLFSYKNELGIDQKLDAGNFMGFSRHYKKESSERSYKSLSHACCLEIPLSVMNEIFIQNNLKDHFYEGLRLLDILKDAYLIYFSLSGSIFFDLVIEAQNLYIPNETFRDEDLTDNLYIITEGSVDVIYEGKFSVKIFKHQHFGGLNLLQEYRRPQRFVFGAKVKAVSIPIEKIYKIPALLWRLIELEEMRYQLGIQGKR